MKKNKKIIVTLLILLGLALIVYIISFFNNAVNELSNNPITLEKEAPSDYLQLFNIPSQKHLVLQSATSYKLRSDIVDLVYNNEYDIQVTRITVKADFDIKRDIVEIYHKSNGIPAKTETSYNTKDFTISYNGISKDNVANIYLTLYGDSTRIYHKTDSITYYYSDLKEGYIQYKPDGIYEVSIKAKSKLDLSSQKKPFIGMFMKKNNFLYYISLCNNVDNKVLSPDVLYELIRNANQGGVPHPGASMQRWHEG